MLLQGDDMSFKFGLCSVSFRKNTPEEILKTMKEAGLSLIEWGADVHPPHPMLNILHKKRLPQRTKFYAFTVDLFTVFCYTEYVIKNRLPIVGVFI